MHPGLRVALGQEPADLVYSNLSLFNPFTGEWEDTSLAVQNGLVVGTGEYRGRITHDFKGAKVIPGLIDSHVHIESSLLTPTEYGRLVLQHGTTTVIADPHEIANVAGVEGLEYMLTQGRRTPLDIFYMLPSCVPATSLDMGGARLSAADLEPFTKRENVIGLAEMMNVPGVLSGDASVWDKLALLPVIDGHAPLLGGKELNAYIFAGIRSDHESTLLKEAQEKLRKGMHIMIREGSTEQNLQDLIPLVNPFAVSRFSFATDDRHADMLAAEGHIDDCIRKAIEHGLDPELAIRMATLSAAEQFGLRDRGAFAPGMVADFCIVDLKHGFDVIRTFKRGAPVTDPGYAPQEIIQKELFCAPLTRHDLRISRSGEARVIGLVENQILTEDIRLNIDASSIPDLDSDILKAVVCDRYRGSGCGVGLVHGFQLKEGAIASSVSHDSHNIVATGADDDDIIRAVKEVIKQKGGIAAVNHDAATVLPLECGGLMSVLPYEEVVDRLHKLELQVNLMGGIRNPFMYLSFLALTVIPHLRLTERGVFDVSEFTDVPLFTR
jgi:adenine deaminase